MSAYLLSQECAGFAALGIEVAPDHASCCGGQPAPPGVLGGWRCSCPCHVPACPTCGSTDRAKRGAFRGPARLTDEFGMDLGGRVRGCDDAWHGETA